MIVTLPAIVRSVRIMRVLCPLGVLGAVIIGYFDYRDGRPFLLAVMAFCCGINVMLSWIQWSFFQINPRRI